jgi:hypothetical protein
MPPIPQLGKINIKRIWLGELPTGLLPAVWRDGGGGEE